MDKYKKVKVLGKGAFGLVSLARSVVTGELVTPPRMVVRQALSVAGNLTGLTRLVVGDGWWRLMMVVRWARRVQRQRTPATAAPTTW